MIVYNKSYSAFPKLMLLVAVLIIHTQSIISQPYFGNGIKNGWADQHSITIWARLTKKPELLKKGKEFLPAKSEDGKEWFDETDITLLENSQIPDGANLNEMIGACPGANGEIRLTYYPTQDPNDRKTVDWQAVDASKNYTTQWHLTGLKSGTSYTVLLEAKPLKSRKISSKWKGSFKTAPLASSETPIKFIVSSCHDFRYRDDGFNGHLLYKAAWKIKPDFFIHTGDVEYYDRGRPFALTERLALFKWDRLFALNNQRSFYSHHTTYFQKDDHDVLRDDCYPGQRYGALTFEQGLEIFDKIQFASNELPYKTIRWGKDLQIWLLEGRNYRSPDHIPDSEKKTILGHTQKTWLFQTLDTSKATYKLIISPTPIIGPDRSEKSDNHANANWRHEGDEIRNFIAARKRIYIISGDRHWQYASHLPGTGLWEFGCGAGSDAHAGGWAANDKRPEHLFLRVKGGFIKGELQNDTSNAPLLKIHFCDVEGNVVFTKHLSANAD
jgi:alkaline phosphatase D